MLEILKKIDNKLVDRFYTLEKNIESKSNSFYESLLALLEGFSKHIVKSEKILIDSDYDTLIGILRVDSFQKFLLSIKVSNDQIEHLFKIAKAINLHKHDQQADIDIDIVIEYLKTSFDLFKLYHDYKNGPSTYLFNANSIYGLFGKTERDLKLLTQEKKRLEDSLLLENSKATLLESDLNRILEIQSDNEEKMLSLESQKQQLLTQINELQEIKLSTMEDKITRILLALNKQNEALNKMTDQLIFSSHLQELNINATKSIKPVVSNNNQIQYKVNFTDFERFFLTQKYLNQSMEVVWKKMCSTKVILPINAKKNSNEKISLVLLKDSIRLEFQNNSFNFSTNLNKNKFSLWFRGFNYNTNWESDFYSFENFSKGPFRPFQKEDHLISIVVSSFSKGILIPNPKDGLLEEFYLKNEDITKLL